MNIKAYTHFVEDIRSKIKAGKLKPGDTLGSSQELAETYSLGSFDIKKGLIVLQQERLILIHAGQHPYVAPDIFQQKLDNIQTLTELIRSYGIQPETEIFAFEWVETPLQAAELFGVSRDQESLLITWRTSFHGEPLGYGETYIVSSIGKAITLEDAESDCIYEIMEKRLGVTIHQVHQTMQAIPAKIDVAIMLELIEGTPLLKAERAVVTRDGKVVAYETAFYRADRFAFTVTMTK
jgi:DNA-binding GntR family transcriptional regulator